MKLALVKALALNEVRLRMRRTSTLVALLAVVIISWAMIADPAGGSALLVVNDVRVLYTSTTLAIGSASLACILFGLGGFYLVRGRMAEDIRSGTGSVIGATPVSNILFLSSRWLGGVAFLGGLMLAFMGTILVLHAVRGDGPIELMVYLQFYALLLGPLVFFTVSCAILFDSVAPLMGKRGDVLFFFVWCMQLGVMIPMTGAGAGVSPIVVFDFSGIASCMLLIRQGVDTTNVALGGGSFNPALAPLHLTSAVWTAQLVAMRFITAAIALLPLLPAVLLFHRFSPDRVKVSRARARRSPLAVANAVLRPLSRIVAPLFRLAAALPGPAGRVLGDVALTLAVSPVAIGALLGSAIAASLVPQTGLGPVLGIAVACWGVLVSDMSTRDFSAGTEDMTGAVPGGVRQRYLRQLGATMLLGFMFMGIVALRFAAADPVRAGAVVAGILGLSALASLFGRCARTSSLFLALFLFGLYLAVNVRLVPIIDAVGFNGVANLQSMTAWLAVAGAALAGGYLWNRRAAS